ncbi:MAG: LON peptidase substrate-binding domain-containing protein, partial [Flavobacteriales bacterium]
MPEDIPLHHLLSDEADDQLSIPLLSSEDEAAMERESTPEDLPILPLRNTVLFPGVVLPINVGRDQSLKLLKEANKGGHDIGVMTQRDGEVENPASADLHDIGTVARIVKMLRMPDGSNTVIIQGKRRCRMGEVVSEEPYLRAKVTPFPDTPEDWSDTEKEALQQSLQEMSMEVIQHSPNLPSEAAIAI